MSRERELGGVQAEVVRLTEQLAGAQRRLEEKEASTHREQGRTDGLLETLREEFDRSKTSLEERSVCDECMCAGVMSECVCLPAGVGVWLRRCEVFARSEPGGKGRERKGSRSCRDSGPSWMRPPRSVTFSQLGRQERYSLHI